MIRGEGIKIRQPGEYMLKINWYKAASYTWLSMAPPYAKDIVTCAGDDGRCQLGHAEVGSYVNMSYCCPEPISLGYFESGDELLFKILSYWHSNYYGPVYSSDPINFRIDELNVNHWIFTFEDAVRYGHEYNDGQFEVYLKGEEPRIPEIKFVYFKPSKPVYELGEVVTLLGRIKVDSNINERDLRGEISVSGIRSITDREEKRKIDFRCIYAVPETANAPALNSYTCYFSEDFSGLREGAYRAKAKVYVYGSEANSPVTADTKFEIRKTSPRPTAILRIKAYDIATGTVVPGAKTIIVRNYRIIPGGREPMPLTSTSDNPLTGRTVGHQEQLPDIVISPPSTGGGAGTSASTSPASRPSWLPASLVKLVVDVINADGVDSIELEPGVYGLISYAKGYTIYEYSNLLIESGRDYNLHAPMSKGLTNIVQKTIRPIIVKRERMVDVLPDTQHSVRALTKTVNVSIKSTSDGYSINDKDSEAFTDKDIEIDNNKLYIKNANIKVRVKIMPAAVTRIVKDVTRVKEIKRIDLRIAEKNKSVYSVEGSEDARILGIIPTKIPVNITIDAETGNVSSVNRPLWAMLAVS